MCKLIWILITVICYIPFSISFEVNKDNCKNNQVLFSPCKFIINIVPPLDSDLQCQLRFTLTNITLVSFINNRTFVKSQEENKCPTVEFNIHNGTDNKFGSTCGDTVDYFSKNFSGFIYGSFIYKNSGLNDSNTNINLQLSLITNCNDAPPPPSSTNKTIIWILIACAVVLIVIIVIIIAIDCNRKVPPKKPNAQLINKEEIDKKQNIKTEKTTEKENFPQESKPMIDETNA